MSYQIASLFHMYIDIGERIAGKQDRFSLIIEDPLRAPKIPPKYTFFSQKNCGKLTFITRSSNLLMNHFYVNYSTKETHIWLPWHIISILGIATHIIWYQTVPRSIWNRMMATINVSRNYPRYQSRTSTGGVSCQKWQFLYFYGHHQKQFVCTHDLTGIQDQCHWTMKCFPLRKSLMRNMWHCTRWFTMTLVSTDQGTTRVVG